jgi:hypothetical protein
MIGYAQFCDHYNLKRIYATPEEHLANLDRMVDAIHSERRRLYAEIDARCPHCSGTGRARPAAVLTGTGTS